MAIITSHHVMKRWKNNQQGAMREWCLSAIMSVAKEQLKPTHLARVQTGRNCFHADGFRVRLCHLEREGTGAGGREHGSRVNVFRLLLPQ